MDELKNILSTGLGKCRHSKSYCKYLVNGGDNLFCIKKNSRIDIESVSTCPFMFFKKKKSPPEQIDLVG